jgi:hypothetical protein
MDGPSAVELDEVRAASAGVSPGSGNMVVRWQSTYGLIVIQVRHGEVFVNGERVEPAARDWEPGLAK